MDNKDQTFVKNENNTYLVETILFSDIIDFFPKNKHNKSFTQALMKIDIEGYEPLALTLESAKKLFDSIDVCIIFMEWGNFKKRLDFRNEIEKMIDFLLSYGLKPYMLHNYGGGPLLDKTNWNMWPTNVHWKKDGY